MKTLPVPAALCLSVFRTPPVRRLLAAAAIGGFLPCLTASAAPGDLDPTFGVGGLAEPFAGMEGYVNALARQTDGKLIAVGWRGHEWAIARYTSDGKHDPTFSGDGEITIDFSDGRDEATAVVIQPDGRIVVGGIARNPTWSDFAVVRLNADGTMDTTFSDDGKVVTQLTTDSRVHDDISSVLLQPDGKILAIGTTAYNNGQFTAVRYLPSGEIDSAFGIKILGYNSGSACGAACLQPDGRILIAGRSLVRSGHGDGTQFTMCRLLADGTLDMSFGSSGWEIWDPTPAGGGESATSIVLQQDGKILVSGTSNESAAVMRYHSSGPTPDGSFSGDGKLLIPPAGAIGYPSVECIARPDGKMLLAGWRPDIGPAGWCLARLTPTGTFDATFSGDGMLPPPPALTSTAGYIMDTLQQPDGKVVVAWMFGIARFIIDEDSDSDGLDDATETVYETSPSDPDSDDDGLLDGAEVATHQTDPKDSDTDNDGLLDGAEVNLHHSNPLLADSDLDGLGDFAEVVTYGTDPDRADSDGDGLSDPDELLVRLTNPVNPDTDGDGLNDGAEVVQYLSNPKNPDSDGDGFTDGYEVEAGKSPTSTASKPALVAETRTAIEYSFPSAIGKTYRIEGSPDMDNWTTVESRIAGTGGLVTRFYSTRNQARRFLRVEEQ